MTGEATARDPRDIVTPDAFAVAPELLGLPLATPRKRLAAILIDLAAVGLLSLSGSLAFALAVGLLSHQLLRGWRIELRRSKAPAVLLALLIGGGVFWLGQQIEGDDEAPEDARAAAELRDTLEAAGENPELLALQKSIEKLRDENERLREEQEPGLLAWGEGILDDIGFGFGWAAAYFTLRLVWWQGQTFGKAALGLRVLRLNGKPLTTWNSFERAGGYAAGLATGLLGFAQIWWDPNRQAIHDKICGTVVIDTRKQVPPASEAPQEQL